LEVLTDDKLKEKQERINKWLNLPLYIAEMEYERATFSQRYYNEHSFYSHIVYDDDRGIISETPKVEKIAINLVDTCAVKDKRIKRIKEQYVLFNECLSYLPAKELDSLKLRFLAFNSYPVFTTLDEYVCEIIQDIKTATETDSEIMKQHYKLKLKNRMEKLK